MEQLYIQKGTGWKQKSSLKLFKVHLLGVKHLEEFMTGS